MPPRTVCLDASPSFFYASRMDFASVIRDARRGSGLSQTELANKAGVCLHSIFELERGNGSISMLEAVTRALDLRFAGIGAAPTFGESVRIMRARKEWSRKTLAERAGVSEPAVARTESGRAYVGTLSAILKVLAPQCRARKPEVSRWLGGNRDCWTTPPDIVRRIEAVVGPIDLDPAWNEESFVQARRTFIRDEDGLSQPWIGPTVFCNPPYSKAAAFLGHAFECWERGDFKIGVLFLPVYTHMVLWHNVVVGNADVFFLNGRVSFGVPAGKKKHAPFGNQIVIYGADDRIVDEMMRQFACVHLSKHARASSRDKLEALSQPILSDAA